MSQPPQCNFGRWYDKSRQNAPYASDPNFIAMDEVHKRIHLLGQAIVADLQRDDQGAALRHIPELCANRDRLVGLLHQLVAAVVLGQDH